MVGRWWEGGVEDEGRRIPVARSGSQAALIDDPDVQANPATHMHPPHDTHAPTAGGTCTHRKTHMHKARRHSQGGARYGPGL